MQPGEIKSTGAYISPNPLAEQSPKMDQFLRNTIMELLNSENESHINEIKEELFKKTPELKAVIDHIIAQTSDDIKVQQVQILYTVLGIKPVQVLEQYMGDREAMLEPFKPLISKLSSIKLSTQDKDDHWYICNESPQADFDPRKYIENFDRDYHSIEDAAKYAFPHQVETVPEQLLSYILGFGPSWEIFALRFHPLSNFKNNEQSCFSNEHYLELGRAITPNPQQVPKEQLVANGKKYSLARINEKRTRDIYKGSEALFEQMESLYLNQQVDDVSFKTDYIQKSMECRRRILSAFSIPKHVGYTT